MRRIKEKQGKRGGVGSHQERGRGLGLSARARPHAHHGGRPDREDDAEHHDCGADVHQARDVFAQHELPEEHVRDEL